MQQISPQALQQLLHNDQTRVVDVREDAEVAIARLEGALHIPMGQIPSRFRELDAAKPVVLLCHHGMRSQQVAQFLESKGFTAVSNLTGGIDAWAEQVDPTMPRY